MHLFIPKAIYEPYFYRILEEIGGEGNAKILPLI